MFWYLETSENLTGLAIEKSFYCRDETVLAMIAVSLPTISANSFPMAFRDSKQNYTDKLRTGHGSVPNFNLYPYWANAEFDGYLPPISANKFISVLVAFEFLKRNVTFCIEVPNLCA